MPLLVQGLPALDVVQWRVRLCEGAAVRALSIPQSNDVIVVAPRRRSKDRSGPGLPMIGLVLVTHGRLAHEFTAALEHILGRQEQMEAIVISAHDDPELCRRAITEAVNRVDS